MRMVQEEHRSDCITTIYEDAGSYVPLARVEHATGSPATLPAQIFYFHTDVNGAPEELTTRDGRVAWRARYKTWGNLALQEWDRTLEWDAMARRRGQNLRFQGQYHDAETGLHYNTFRYYDPEMGRFCSQDPIGLRGGINLYQYAPDPINWIDPWGLAACAPGRAGKQARLRALANDDKLGSADRGWIRQEMNAIDRGTRSSIRNPPGKDLAHERGREAAKGYGYDYSNLQDRDLHRLQHKYDDYGRTNPERPPE
jgi:RHS repeat-associated protein